LARSLLASPSIPPTRSSRFSSYPDTPLSPDRIASDSATRSRTCPHAKIECAKRTSLSLRPTKRSDCLPFLAAVLSALDGSVHIIETRFLIGLEGRSRLLAPRATRSASMAPVLLVRPLARPGPPAPCQRVSGTRSLRCSCRKGMVRMPALSRRAESRSPIGPNPYFRTS
jgi:hypothetical protein